MVNEQQMRDWFARVEMWHSGFRLTKFVAAAFAWPCLVVPLAGVLGILEMNAYRCQQALIYSIVPLGSTDECA
jgi:hypothetical protein